MFIYILLKLIECQLVPVFEAPIVLSVLLHGIVREVHSVVLAVVQNVVERGCAHVSLFAKEYFHILVDYHIHPDIELSTINEVRPLDVLLNDKTHVLVDLNGCRKLV